MVSSDVTSKSKFISNPRRIPAMALLMPLLLSVLAPVALVAPVGAQEANENLEPEDI